MQGPGDLKMKTSMWIISHCEGASAPLPDIALKVTLSGAGVGTVVGGSEYKYRKGHPAGSWMPEVPVTTSP